MNANQLLPSTEPAVQKRDILWKGIMEDLFADFLRFFFAHADSIFDIDRGFEFLDKELHEITPDSKVKHPRFVDKLVKTWYKDGTEKWLLVHIEVQGYADKSFPARMFTYFYRICDKFHQEITSLAIFTDEDDKYHPDRYEYNCFGTSLLFRFNTYKVKAQDKRLLEESNNPFATVILMVLSTIERRGGDPVQLLESSLALVRRLYEKGFPKEKAGRLLQFIKRYVNFGDSGLLLKFEEEIKAITDNPDNMGIYEQILQMEKAEVEERNKTMFVRNLLRNTSLSIQTIAESAEVSVDFVIEVKNSLSERENG
ncbi:hypothetical protein HNQ91_001589 [Filimonas zeae]|uniref:Transposase (putative) YhgA-like domain-containing protein n=1 Tax=Filimonas zeae TaxID=1737353 RepID=A0A917J100_9BACT|nr:hypothetical protein [Filimonas zeae]MDR6338538.1 hypothetical protein [Filimonas zeae]GGH67762.1 hypothetical protein GCM10011379_23400 [Filimonas zeae]